MFVIYCESKMGWSNAAHVNMYKIVSNSCYMTKGLGSSVGCKSRARGLKLLPCGHNDLKAVWKLKHNHGLRSVSPISRHTLFRPTGQPVTKANQHLGESNSMATLGTPASVHLLSMIISSAKQTSNYVKTTLACEKKLEPSELGFGSSKIYNSSTEAGQDRLNIMAAVICGQLVNQLLVDDSVTNWEWGPGSSQRPADPGAQTKEALPKFFPLKRPFL